LGFSLKDMPGLVFDSSESSSVRVVRNSPPDLRFVVWCSVFKVWCAVFGVWCLVFGVWCLVFGIWCLVLGASCLVCGVW